MRADQPFTGRQRDGMHQHDRRFSVAEAGGREHGPHALPEPEILRSLLYAAEHQHAGAVQPRLPGTDALDAGRALFCGRIRP